VEFQGKENLFYSGILLCPSLCHLVFFSPPISSYLILSLSFWMLYDVRTWTKEGGKAQQQGGFYAFPPISMHSFFFSFLLP